MHYSKPVLLKDGRTCVLRNGTAADGTSSLDLFIRMHAQTDWLLSYPDEIGFTADQQARYLREKADSEIELLAELDGSVVGMAGFAGVGKQEKLRRRAEFGISLDRAYWSLGIGRALTESCIECAAAAGYAQLEMDVVEDNKQAIALYRSAGFTEYGRNPCGFYSRRAIWQPLDLMRLVLPDGTGQTKE